jgi:FkbM family methyltransferase
VRSLARKTGLIRIINRLRPSAPYEQRVHDALVSSIRPGDAVWDVGANVGLYTKLFCEIVGRDGAVVAFEPLPASCEQIRTRLPQCTWLRVENIALGDADHNGRLLLEKDSVEHHLAPGDAASDDSIPVQVCRGDSILEQLGRVPNIVKVDVEGFEQEVLHGMERTLRESALRTVL